MRTRYVSTSLKSEGKLSAALCVVEGEAQDTKQQDMFTALFLMHFI